MMSNEELAAKGEVMWEQFRELNGEESYILLASLIGCFLDGFGDEKARAVVMANMVIDLGLMDGIGATSNDAIH
jgi:hypothetical protein